MRQDFAGLRQLLCDTLAKRLKAMGVGEVSKRWRSQTPADRGFGLSLHEDVSRPATSVGGLLARFLVKLPERPLP